MRLRGSVSLVAAIGCALLFVGSALAQGRAPTPDAAANALNPNLKALADTERAFARLGAEKGVRESFLAYFTEDGVWFVPAPSRTAADLRSRPAPTGPPRRKLEWAPLYGDVSRAGDLGYDTGPSANSDLTDAHGPTRYGYFFSIWKKQANGDWRVVLDLGTQTPDVWDPTKQPEVRAAPASGYKPKGAMAHTPLTATVLENETASLNAAEAAFSKAAQSEGIASASARDLDAHARMHRNDLSPVVGRENIRAFLAKKDFRPHWEPMHSDIAASADLGYTYGKYWAPGIGEKGAEETGYYVHVWRKDARGDWKLVFDVTSPAPFAAAK